MREQYFIDTGLSLVNKVIELSLCSKVKLMIILVSTYFPDKVAMTEKPKLDVGPQQHGGHQHHQQQHDQMAHHQQL